MVLYNKILHAINCNVATYANILAVCAQVLYSCLLIVQADMQKVGYLGT